MWTARYDEETREMVMWVMWRTTVRGLGKGGACSCAGCVQRVESSVSSIHHAAAQQGTPGHLASAVALRACVSVLLATLPIVVSSQCCPLAVPPRPRFASSPPLDRARSFAHITHSAQWALHPHCAMRSCAHCLTTRLSCSVGPPRPEGPGDTVIWR